MQTLDIQAFSYQERQSLLPDLAAGLAACGGWLLERKTLSPAMLQFRVEIQFSDVMDFYASMIEAGLELTRCGHVALTDLCTCRRQLTSFFDLSRVVTILLEITFLEDVALPSPMLAAMAWA